jgi:hypothetical protein
MDRQREHIAFIVKRTLGTVAMMHIPVKHRDAPNLTQCPRTLYRDGNIAQQAKTPPAIRLGMMPRRPAECVGAASYTQSDILYCSNGQPCRLFSRRQTASGIRRAIAPVAATLKVATFKFVQITPGMEILEISASGRRWLDNGQLIDQPRHFQKVLEPTFTLWAFRSRLRLQKSARGRKHTNGPRIVPETALVPVKSRRVHRITSSGSCHFASCC